MHLDLKRLFQPKPRSSGTVDPHDDFTRQLSARQAENERYLAEVQAHLRERPSPAPLRRHA